MTQRPNYGELATPANMRRLADLAGEPIAAPGIVSYSPVTGEQYSASAGDYWNSDPDEPLRDSQGYEMFLGRLATHIEPV